MNTGLWYLSIIAVISIVVGLFEIWGIAHYRVRWGEPLPEDKVWGKPLFRKAPFKLVGFQLLTRYHFFMYVVVVPIFVLGLGLLLRRATACPPAHWLGWLIFTISGTLGIMVLEDFLFFVFSTLLGTPYPHALTRLFRGEASWHPSQINFFGRFRLPAVYLWLPPIVGFLLWIVVHFGL